MGWLLILSPSPTLCIKNSLPSFHFLLINALYDHLCNPPRGPLHNISILCMGWRVRIHNVQEFAFSRPWSLPLSVPFLNLSYRPLGVYPTPCKRARERVGRWTTDTLFHLGKCMHGTIAVNTSIFGGGSGEAPHSPRLRRCHG